MSLAALSATPEALILSIFVLVKRYDSRSAKYSSSTGKIRDGSWLDICHKTTAEMTTVVTKMGVTIDAIIQRKSGDLCTFPLWSVVPMADDLGALLDDNSVFGPK